MSSFEEFLRPSGSEKDTLAGRTSLDAFDRGISLYPDENIAPAGSETEVHDGMMPVSRLIVIEDADYLGHIRQAYLRRMMETVGGASRFVLVARAPSRIIDALRSRSQMIRIPSTDRETITTTLSEIAEKNGCIPAEGVLEDISYISEGNLKKAVFTLGDARFQGACFRSLVSSQDGSGINSSSREETSRIGYSRQGSRMEVGKSTRKK